MLQGIAFTKKETRRSFGPGGCPTDDKLGWIQDFAFFAVMAAQPQFGI